MTEFHKQRYARLAKNYAEMFKVVLGLKEPGEIDVAARMVQDLVDAAAEIANSRPNKELKGNFFAPIPDYGDVMTLEAFQETCKVDGFIDYDGSGHPAGVESGTYVPPHAPFFASHLRMDPNVHIRPSEHDDVPEGTTHIVWFNK